MAGQTKPTGLPIERRGPFRGPLARPVRSLAYERIHPVVRIAHRVTGLLLIPERIIFDHELVYIAAGECEASFGGEAVRLEAGHLLLVEPFVPHSFGNPSRQPVTHAAIHFDLSPEVPARVRPYAVRLTAGVILPRLSRFALDGTVSRAIDQLIAAHADPAVPSPLVARTHLLRVLTEMLSPRSESSVDQRNRRRVEAVAAAVRKRFAEPLTAADLAAVVDLSVPHLTRLFRDTMGFAPMEYVRRVRIDQAKRLLADMSLSVKQIARSVGFEDPLHFSRVFRRMDGLPPTAYREAVLAGRTGG